MTVTDADVQPHSIDEVLADLRAWLEKNWDPDLTVGEWWRRLGEAGWSIPILPPDAYGKGLTRADAGRVSQEISRFGALTAPAGLGQMLAAPTIATHGTREQIDTYVRGLVTGQRAWCQLFSEPGAGSDLAGLQTKAERDGDEWIVNGQKVWTSGAQIADMGMLLARTDPDVPKHEGITWFAFNVRQPGVEIRPLKEMTGRAMFNEVFMTDARVSNDAVIGSVNRGWAVANTTLMYERAGIGIGGGGGAISAASPGTRAGHLDRRAGDFVKARPDAAAQARRDRASGGRMLAQFAKLSGVGDDQTIRQDLVRLHILNEVGRFNALRVKAAKQAGQDLPGMANIAKLQTSDVVRMSRDLGLRIAGPYGTLHAYQSTDRAALAAATGNPFLAGITELALGAQAPPIYGGTDQIQRNIIAERVLGLPREPSDDKVVPFRDLPKNG